MHNPPVARRAGLASALAIGLVASLAVMVGPASPASAAPDDPVRGADRGAGTRAPAFVDGLNEPATSGDRVVAAQDHLRRHRDDYHVDVRSLRLAEKVTDGSATTVRFDQTYRGVPVFGAQYLVHFDGPRVIGTSGRYFTDLDVPVRAGVSPERAEEHAMASLHDPRLRRGARATSQGLVVLPQGDGVLAQRVLVTGFDQRSGLPMRREVFVEAQTGVVVLSYDNVQASDQVRGTGLSTTGQKLPVNLTKVKRGFDLRDRSRRMWNGRKGEIVTYGLDGAPIQSIPGGLPPASVKPAHSRSKRVTGALSRKGVVDAHWGAGQVYRYYEEKLGRRGLDGRGGSMISMVGGTDGGEAWVNAYWDGKKMVYGTGDQEYRPLSSELDVVGHEMTHGVIEHSAGLIYFNQSGAMNEALADYFGNAIDVDRSRTPMDSPRAGLLGENLCRTKSPRECALRDLNDGRTAGEDYIGATLATDNGGVHLNSTIFSGALWDIREELPTGLADRVIYRALTHYMTPLDTFFDGRRAVESAAKAMKLSKKDRRTIAGAFVRHGIVKGWESGVDVDSTLLKADIAVVDGTPEAANGWWTATDSGRGKNQRFVVYAGRTDGAGQIQRISPNDGRWHVNPTTDGTNVYWVAYGAEDVQVLMRPLAGGPITVLHTTYADLSDLTVDETHVAWYETRGGINSDVWYVDKSDPGAVRNADPAYGTITFSPVLADGRLAFAVLGGDADGFGFRVASMDLETEEVQRTALIAQNEGYDMTFGNVTATDGHLFWSQDTYPGGQVGIYRSNLDTSEVTAVVEETSPDAPSWSFLDATDGWLTYDSRPSLNPRTAEELPRLYQRPADDSGPAVRVSCNRGAQEGAASDQGRGVVWLDGTRGRTDLVAVSEPSGECGAD